LYNNEWPVVFCPAHQMIVFAIVSLALIVAVVSTVLKMLISLCDET